MEAEDRADRRAAGGDGILRLAHEPDGAARRPLREAHPNRFRAMATLPLADPEAAAKELERCVKELGFVGVLLYGQYKGHWLDEPQFLPIFEKAAELDIPVYLHPALINPQVQQAMYMSPAYSAVTGAELSSAAIGWHYDVGIRWVPTTSSTPRTIPTSSPPTSTTS